MPTSMDSSWPILAPSLKSNHTSARYSTSSVTPILAPSAPLSTEQEIKEITEGLQKLENKQLASQRFVPSREKSENLSMLALGAKLDRALGRRMAGQDAVMRKKVVQEKQVDEKEVV